MRISVSTVGSGRMPCKSAENRIGRASCPSKRPRRENVTFFRAPQEAEKAGFRACLRCRPKAVSGNPRQEMIKAVCRYIEQHLDEPITLARLSAEFRQSPFHLQRTFK